MRTYKAKLTDLDKVMNEILTEYAGQMTEGTKEAVKTVAENAKEETKAGSPVGKGKKRGKYRKGWAVRTEEERLSVTSIVHNRTDYQLAHLLEKGHALRQGGRSPALPHIEPAEQKAIKELQRMVEKLAQG